MPSNFFFFFFSKKKLESEKEIERYRGRWISSSACLIRYILISCLRNPNSDFDGLLREEKRKPAMGPSAHILCKVDGIHIAGILFLSR